MDWELSKIALDSLDNCCNYWFSRLPVAPFGQPGHWAIWLVTSASPDKRAVAIEGRMLGGGPHLLCSLFFQTFFMLLRWYVWSEGYVDHCLLLEICSRDEEDGERKTRQIWWFHHVMVCVLPALPFDFLILSQLHICFIILWRLYVCCPCIDTNVSLLSMYYPYCLFVVHILSWLHVCWLCIVTSPYLVYMYCHYCPFVAHILL